MRCGCPPERSSGGSRSVKIAQLPSQAPKGRLSTTYSEPPRSVQQLLSQFSDALSYHSDPLMFQPLPDLTSQIPI